jgi:sphingomyelin phosphodiesterase
MAALEAIPTLTGTKDTGFAWTLYTGDLGSHDPDNQLSRYEDARDGVIMC